MRRECEGNEYGFWFKANPSPPLLLECSWTDEDGKHVSLTGSLTLEDT